MSCFLLFWTIVVSVAAVCFEGVFLCVCVCGWCQGCIYEPVKTEWPHYAHRIIKLLLRWSGGFFLATLSICKHWCKVCMSSLAGNSEWFTCIHHLLCFVKEEEGMDFFVCLPSVLKALPVMASFSCFTSVAHIVLKWPWAVDRMSAFSHLLTWLISVFF